MLKAPKSFFLKNMLGMEGGFIFSTGVLAVLGLLLLTFFSFIASVSFLFVASALTLVIIVLMVVGWFKFHYPFYYIIAIASVSVGIITAIEINSIVAAGGMILGFSLYSYNAKPNKGIWLTLFLISLSLLVLVYGSTLVIQPMGVYP